LIKNDLDKRSNDFGTYDDGQRRQKLRTRISRSCQDGVERHSFGLEERNCMVYDISNPKVYLQTLKQVMLQKDYFLFQLQSPTKEFTDYR
jgi:hypothetical protein